MRAAWAARVGALVCVCAGCARPVDVTGSPTDSACDPFLGSLPVTIAEQTVRETVPRDVSASAWGDPPIIVRCGVPTPVGLNPASALIDVESTTWFPEDLTNGTMFTSVGITPRIEVTVPRDYAPEVNVLLDLAPAVSAHTSPTP